MKQPLKYVNYYKRILEKGCAQGFCPDDELTLHLSEQNAPGCYLTPVFDTRDPETVYHRLVVDGTFTGGRLEVLCAAADDLALPVDEAHPRLDAFLADPAVDSEEKAQAMRTLCHVQAVNAQDLLLHSLQGRYVWVMVRFWPAGPATARLAGLRLEFPKCSFTEYLPEIYQQDDFFDRYMALFQSLYLDQEKTIDQLPRQLDYENADDATVAQLAGWVGIENIGGVFTTDQLKELIRNSDLYQGGKGTRRALEQVLQLVTGQCPRIVEHFQWAQLGGLSPARQKLLDRLYGAGDEDFCVILDRTQATAPLAVSAKQLEELIGAYSVLGTRGRLVFLSRCSNTDTHCYLDVNSYLATPTQAAVDHVQLGGYITVG